MLKSQMSSFVVSSCTRLCRNIEGEKFVPTMSTADASRILEKISPYLIELGLNFFRLTELNPLEVESLREQNLISNALLANADIGAIAISQNRETCISVLDIDHLRIQTILHGFELEKAFATVNKIDDALTTKLIFVYDSRLGFLTCNPTNIGCGLDASVEMFLPGLNILGNISKLNRLQEMKHVNFQNTNECSANNGFFYRLSNNCTLGLSESEIIGTISESVSKIASLEEAARERLMTENLCALKDRIFRAWGILLNSFVINYSETANELSFIKLGNVLGLIKLKDAKILDELLIECRPATLKQTSITTGIDLDVLRAEKLKFRLESIKI